MQEAKISNQEQLLQFWNVALQTMSNNYIISSASNITSAASLILINKCS